MELLYIYFGNYKGKAETEINFSNEITFKFKKESFEIDVNKNCNFVKNFYGNHIKSITALVGENGLGKTTVLKFLGDYLDIEFSPAGELTLMIFRVGDRKKKRIVAYYSSSGLRPGEEISWGKVDGLKASYLSKIKKYYDNNENSKIQEIEQLFRVYYTTQKDNNLDDSKANKCKYDISKQTFSNEAIINSYQLLTNLSKKELLKKIKPEHLYIDDDFANCDLKSKILDVVKFDQERRLMPYIEIFGEAVYDYLFYDYIDTDLKEELLKIRSLLETKSEIHQYKNTRDKFAERIRNIEIHYPGQNIYDDFYYNMIESLQRLVNSELIDQYYYHRVNFNYLSKVEFQEFIKKFKVELIPTNQLIKDMWELIIGLEKITLSSNVKTILLILDEPNNNFHPKMQLQMISTYIEILKYYHDKLQVDFQVVFSTHSPLVLTEILSEDVVVLNQDSKVKTFGANAFSLYYDVYNIERPQGDFFYKKYDNLIKCFDEEVDASDELIKEANVIYNSMSDGVLKQYLKKYIDDNSEDKKRSMKTLERELLDKGVDKETVDYIKSKI